MPPNAHDDYLDLDAAWREYDRAYVLWGQAVDGNEENGWKRAPEPLCNRRARRMAKALRELNRAALAALEGIKSRGWPI